MGYMGSVATTGGHRKMARTPLLRALQQLASEHAEASMRGIPVEEVRRLRLAAISRRDFLKGAGAVAAGLTLSGTLAGRELIENDPATGPALWAADRRSLASAAQQLPGHLFLFQQVLPAEDRRW